MASPYVKKLAKDFGKSEKEMEKHWNKAKNITSDTFNKEEFQFGEKEYNYTIEIIKNLLGIKEEVLDPSVFLNSDLNAKEFIETITSSSFPSLDKNLIPPKKKEDDEDEDDEDDEKKDFDIPDQDENSLKDEDNLIETVSDDEWGQVLDEIIEKIK